MAAVRYENFSKQIPHWILTDDFVFLNAPHRFIQFNFIISLKMQGRLQLVWSKMAHMKAIQMAVQQMKCKSIQVKKIKINKIL